MKLCNICKPHRRHKYCRQTTGKLSLLLVILSFLCLPACPANEFPSAAAGAPPPPGTVFTFTQAIDMALKNYPAIARAQALESAALSGISLAKTAYLPRGDLVVQENRASENGFFGTYFPLVHLPIVTGPPVALKPRNFDSVWASAGGATFSLELIDFGLRRSQVNAARSLYNESSAQTRLTQLDVATSAADAFVGLVAAEQKVKAASADVERMQIFSTAVHTFVDNKLRPGVDASRADAELALSRDDLIHARQTREVQRATLAEKLGLAGQYVEVDPGPFTTIPSSASQPTLQPFEFHPLVLVNAATIRTVLARQEVLKHSWYPHILAQSAIQGRGSGYNTGGSLTREGFLPTIPNWAAGLTATFSLFDIFEIKAKQRIERAEERAARARLAETMQILKGQDARARALIEGAEQLALNAPFFLKSAQDTETRARTRYKVGLGTVVEVAEAERLLTDAQVTYDLAGLNVWRSFLAAASAHGNLGPFIQMVSSTPAPGGK